MTEQEYNTKMDRLDKMEKDLNAGTDGADVLKLAGAGVTGVYTLHAIDTNQYTKAKVSGAVTVGLLLWYFLPKVNLKGGNPFGDDWGWPNQQDGTKSGSDATKNDKTDSTTNNVPNMNQSDKPADKGYLPAPDDCIVILKDGTSRPCTDAEARGQVNGIGQNFNKATDFISAYKGLLKSESLKNNINPGVIIGLARLESTYKESDGAWTFGQHPIALNANNFFNIKADANWRGDSFAWGGEMWRYYDSIEDSIKDAYAFLATNSRYRNAGLFTALDAASQADAIARGGYNGTAPADIQKYSAALVPVAQDSVTQYNALPDLYYPIQTGNIGGGIIASALFIALAAAAYKSKRKK